MSAALKARGAVWTALGLLLVLAGLEFSRPDLLIVGNITIDLVDGTTPTGGAVSYAAVAARAVGAKGCVVTVAGPESKQQLSIFDGHHLTVLPANVTQTFSHTYTWWGSHRKLKVTANPNITITRSHVPLWCRLARTVLLGPLTLDDVDAGSFVQPDGFLGRLLYPASQQQVGLMAQGFQRQLGPDGDVLPLAQPSQRLLDGLAPHVTLFLSDVETDSWPKGSIEKVAARTERTLVTLGDKGAHEYGLEGGAPKHIQATKITAVDTNGAGDTFATIYMIAKLLGDPDPGATASWAASRAVLQPQSCKPRCAPALIPGGPVSNVTNADRVRLSAAALLRRAGLSAASETLARQDGLVAAFEAALSMLGIVRTSQL